MIADFIAFAQVHNDQINGSLEIGGASLNCLSIRRLYRAKKLEGIHWSPTALFLLWGLWNTIFYPVNHLWISFYCGLVILVTNTVWLWLVFWYWLNDHLPDDPLDAPCEDAV